MRLGLTGLNRPRPGLADLAGLLTSLKGNPVASFDPHVLRTVVSSFNRNRVHIRIENYITLPKLQNFFSFYPVTMSFSLPYRYCPQGDTVTST